MKLAMVVLVLVAIGCGASETKDRDLPGYWELVRTDGCVLGMTFDVEQAGAYSMNIACQLDSGTIGVDHDEGAYDSDTKRIMFARSATTCPDKSILDGSYGYNATSSTLQIIGTDGALVFTRVQPGGAGVSVFGCLDSATHSFTPHDLVHF